jgi:hypothetical protein
MKKPSVFLLVSISFVAGMGLQTWVTNSRLQSLSEQVGQYRAEAEITREATLSVTKVVASMAKQNEKDEAAMRDISHRLDSATRPRIVTSGR